MGRVRRTITCATGMESGTRASAAGRSFRTCVPPPRPGPVPGRRGDVGVQGLVALAAGVVSGLTRRPDPGTLSRPRTTEH